MARMKSDPSTGRVTISGVREDVLEAFDELADAEGKSRSEKVVELLEREVSEEVPDETGDYLPTDGELRGLYEAALEKATMPEHTLRFDLRGGQLAQNAGMSKSEARAQLFRLEARGYVRHQVGATGGQTREECYNIKPRCARPRAWKYSRIRDTGDEAADDDV